MNITREYKDELNAVIKINLTEKDYEPKVDKALKDYRRKAQIKGFRPGKAPLGLIKKMVGTHIKVEEIDRLVSETLSKYIVDEKLHVLGQPLPSLEQKQLDLDKEKDFDFLFDVAVAPEVELTINKRTKVPYYTLKVDEDLIEKEVKRNQQQYSKPLTLDTVTDNSYVKGDIAELDTKGNILEGGISAEDTMIATDIIKDDKIKKAFVGTKVDETFDFDLKKAYPNDTEIAGILKTDKENITELKSKFRFTPKEITSYEPAELNQELFDQVFGEGEIKSEEEFKERIKNDIAEIYVSESEFRFGIDVKDKLISKTKLPLPTEFLKRWLLITNTEGEKPLTEDVLEKEFPEFAKDLQWQLIKGKISKEQEFEVTLDDLKDESRKFTEAQFRQYGMPMSALSEEHLQTFIDKNLESEESRNRFAEAAMEKKVVAYLKENLKLDEKEISMDDFKKLYE